MPSSYMTSSVDYPSLDHSVNCIEPTQTGNRSHPVSAVPTQRSLAEAFHQRGVGQSIAGWSGLSTPNNSPGCPSPDGSSSHFFQETWGLIAQGAKMIRRTFTGKETPVRAPVPRISRKELEVFKRSSYYFSYLIMFFKIRPSLKCICWTSWRNLVSMTLTNHLPLFPLRHCGSP